MPDDAKGHRDFHHRFPVLVLNDDLADVSLVDQFFDLGDQLFTVDLEFFGVGFSAMGFSNFWMVLYPFYA